MIYRVTQTGAKCSGGPTYVDDVRMIGPSLNECWSRAPIRHLVSLSGHPSGLTKKPPAQQTARCLGRDRHLFQHGGHQSLGYHGQMAQSLAPTARTHLRTQDTTAT